MFSLRLAIYINSGTRYKAQGVKQKSRSQEPGVRIPVGQASLPAKD